MVLHPAQCPHGFICRTPLTLLLLPLLHNQSKWIGMASWKENVRENVYQVWENANAHKRIEDLPMVLLLPELSHQTSNSLWQYLFFICTHLQSARASSTALPTFSGCIGCCLLLSQRKLHCFAQRNPALWIKNRIWRMLPQSFPVDNWRLASW